MQKLHTADKPLRCKRCHAEFPDRYTYKIHAKTHEGEKCYSCELCPYASISARHLESHMLIHTDQKPYDCDQCNQSFRQKQLLRRHVNLYHNPDYVPPKPLEKRHSCSTCGKTFRHKGNLIRHMATHDPDAFAGGQEEARRLRQGRQRKFEMIDGKPVEMEEYEIVEMIVPEGDEEDEENDEEYEAEEDEDEYDDEMLENDEEYEEGEIVVVKGEMGDDGRLIGVEELEEGEMHEEGGGEGDGGLLEVVEEEDEEVCYVDDVDGHANVVVNVREDDNGDEYVVLNMMAPQEATSAKAAAAETVIDEFILSDGE